MATYDNTIVGAAVTGTNDADSIHNSGTGATLSGGAGADSIDNYASSVSIDGGADNDYLQNWDWNNEQVTVRGGDGNDTLRNVGAYTTLDGGAGNDSIHNWNDLVSIAGGEGADSIHNSNYYSKGNSVTIDGGAGNDSIINFAGNVTMTGGEDDDTIYSYGGYSSIIDGGTGNDKILNGWITDSSLEGTNATLIGGAGDDTINNDSDSVSINAGTGNDLISLSSNADNNVLVFTAGDGNNTVIGFNETDTLKIDNDGKGVYSTQISGDDMVVNIADNNGAVTLQGAATLEAVNIEGTLSNVIVNRNSNTTVRGTSYILKPDAIYNHGHDVTIQALGGDDQILNYGVALSDTSNSAGSNVSINAGNGNDSVSNHGRYAAIDGGAGNDSIFNSSWGINSTLNGGAGNDSIHNDASEVKINAGAGNDNVYNHNGSNTLIDLGDGDDSVYNRDNHSTILGGEGNDTFNNNYYSDNVLIDGGAGDDYFIYNWGRDSTLLGGDGNDTMGTYKNGYSGGKLTYSLGGANSKMDGGTGDDFIETNAEYVSMSGGAGADTIRTWGISGTILGGDGDDSIINARNSSLKGYNFIDGGAGNDFISSEVFIGDYTTIDGGADNDTIETRGSWASISGGAGNDSILSTGSSMEVTINPGGGNDTVTFASVRSQLIEYATGDGNDLIQGFNSLTTLQIDGGTGTYSQTVSGSDVIVTVGDGKITLSGAASLDAINISGFKVDDKLITLSEGDDNYFTRSSTLSGATINALGGNDSVYNGVAESLYVDMGAGNDTISNANGRSNATLFGGDDDDTISNTGGGASINGGNGNDSIYNGGSNSTMHGGSGKDSIENRIGNALIYGEDGDDRIINTSTNVTIYGGNGADSIENHSASNGATIHGDADNDTIKNNGSNALIFGDAGNDFISLGSYSQNATIEGGAGNDTVKLSGGNNLVNYTAGAGNDSVVDFSATDTLSISGGTYSKETVNNDVVLTVGEGKITLTGAASLDALNIDGSLIGGGENINNTVSNKLITGTAYDDTIANSGANVTINARAGNDSISLGSGATNNLLVFKADDGSDTVSGFKANSTVSIAGTAAYTKDSLDNDVIISMVSGGSITLSDAASLSANVNIKGGKLSLRGGINLSNYSTNNPINGTTANDTLRNYAGGTTILGKDGNDYIYNSTNADYKINDGFGYVTIDGGAGNDTIFSYDPNVSISGGANADLISLRSSNFGGVTINAGTGNDTIYGNGNSYGVLYQYGKGDGNDLIVNFGSNDTLSISGGSYTREIDAANNVLISVEGSGVITLRGAGDKTVYIYPPDGETGKYINNTNDGTLLSGSSSADTIKNYGDKVTIAAWSGNDTIYNNCGDDTSINAGYGDDSVYGNNNRVTVTAGAGNDTITGNHYRSKLGGDAGDDLISITTYWYNTLLGGDGNDTIIANGGGHSADGGAGADLISLGGDALTVRGGTGNDTIYGNTATSHLYGYDKGDGDDIIYNYGSNDSITISGSTWSTSTSGENVIVNITDSGNITLAGANGKTLNIYPTPTPTPTITTAVSAQDVIKNFMGYLDTTSSAGKAALDKAVSIATGGYFANISAAIEQMTLDCAAAGNGDTFLKDYCGIDLDNDDTGAITGYDAGGSSVKTAQSIVEETGSLDNFTGSTFTTNGLTVKLADFDNDIFNPYSISYSSLSNDTKKYIWQAFKTWWAGGALDLIAESYGNNYGFSSDSSATVKELYFGFRNETSNTLAATPFRYYTGSGKTIQLGMYVNMYHYNSITIGDVDGKRNSSGFYLDRTLAHEMTHAVMAANINHFADLSQFITEGMAELTHGIDDERTYTIRTLANNADALNNSLSLMPGTGTNNAYAGGYMFLRYLAKQGAEHYPTLNGNGNLAGNFSISQSNGNSDAVTVSGKLMTIAKDFADDAIDLTDYASVNNVDASALAKGIAITGNTLANSIKAGAGNDTVFANVGNDKLLGGAGNDVLSGEAGNDSINGEAGNDTLSGGSGDDTLTGGEGKDVFVHVADNDLITDYNEDDDTIQLVEGKVIGASLSGSNVILDVGIRGSVTVQDGADKTINVIDGEGAAWSTLISGGNSIVGSAKADTLVGTAGNDTFTGGYGADTFVYTGGNDVITDYGANFDKVSLAGDGAKYLSHITGVDVSGSNVKLTFSNDSSKTLTLLNAANKKVIVNGATRCFLDKQILSYDKTAVTLTSAFGGTFKGGSYKNINASAATKSVTISGGNSGGVSIVGGAKADSIVGTAGNDTLTGGYGADTFVYTGGNDVITDYAANFDKISLAGGDNARWLSHITNAAVKGNDVTLTFSNDAAKTLTLKNSVGKKILINEDACVFGRDGTKTIIIRPDFTGSFTASNYQVVDASAVKASVTLSGGNGNGVSIVGGAKADSIVGTAGNDTLTGGYGADTFTYTGGNDVITDYAANFDKIQLNGDGAKWLSHITGVAVKNKDVTLTFSNDSSKTLTLNNAAGKKVIINGVTRTFTASADAYWFDENDFGDAQLDSITDSSSDYSIGKLDTADTLTKLTRDEFLLTFGDDK